MVSKEEYQKLIGDPEALDKAWEEEGERTEKFAVKFALFWAVAALAAVLGTIVFKVLTAV